MSSTPPVLYLKDISLNIGKDELFSEVNIQLYKNERVCLVGKNGSGKSTVLKIIAPAGISMPIQIPRRRVSRLRLIQIPTQL